MTVTNDTTDTSRRQSVLDAVELLFTSGVMSHSGHANLSVRVDQDTFMLTTTGMVRGLRPDQLATVTLDGDVVEGDLAAENAEIVSMHSVAYRARPDMGAIIHTHSPAAASFALAHRELPCRVEPLLRFGQAQPVPVASWGPRGSGASVRAISEVLDTHRGTSAVLLANHGLLAFGTDPVAAARLVVAIEEAAEAELGAASLGGAVDFPAGALDAVVASMARSGS